jgi:hypothetical protein
MCDGRSAFPVASRRRATAQEKAFAFDSLLLGNGI